MRQRIWRSNVRPISLCSNGANVLLQRNIDRRDVLRPTEHARNVRSSVHLGSAVTPRFQKSNLRSAGFKSPCTGRTVIIEG
jgi:hypothetical protein